MASIDPTQGRGRNRSGRDILKDVSFQIQIMKFGSGLQSPLVQSADSILAKHISLFLEWRTTEDGMLYAALLYRSMATKLTGRSPGMTTLSVRDQVQWD